MGEQLTDRWWNCKAERGSIRSSFNTAIEVLEGGGISRNQFEFGLDLILEALHRTANSSAG